MSHNFLEFYKNFKVGDKIKIKKKYIPPFHLQFNIYPPVHSDFVSYIFNNSNLFTITSMQEYDDDIIICVWEVPKGVLGYKQISHIPSRVVNWSKI